MSIFELARVPRMTAGIGARRRIGVLAAELAGETGRAVLVADPGLRATGMVEEIASIVVKAGVEITLFTEFKSDPTVEQADHAAEIARDCGAGLVISLGGGSALDLGKSVAAITPAKHSAVAYELCGIPFPSRGLKKLCIPTTSGTGSETTRTAILTRADGAKVWLWGDELKSDEVVLDPELTVTLPPAITAATGIDALVHAVEAATNRNANPLGDVFAYEAIRLVAGYLARTVENPSDLTARAALQRAAALAGVAIDNCGTGIAHALGHAMGSLRPIPHGRAVGIAMLASMPWNIQGNEERFGVCAVAMGAEPSARSFCLAYEHLVRAIGMKVELADEFAGVSAEALAAQTARPENAAMRASNRRASSDDDLLSLARRVLSIA
jgi:alcohol dehydrogenase class IV